MTDKIRIVGAFGRDVIGPVQEFADSLDGVQYVSVLIDGVEALPDTAPAIIDPTAPDAPVPPDVPEAPPAESSSEGEPAPPFDAATNADRRVGPEDRREAPAQA
jgi:hypothetical protein